MTTSTRTANTLAALAEVSSPDGPDSPGARFLHNVESDYLEMLADDQYDEDTAHEIADNAVPVYTHERWQVFVDLCAYQEDTTELEDPGGDLTQSAAVALYMIAQRLVYALHAEQ